MKKLILALTLLITPHLSMAHEGHNHSPGSEAPHGGVVKEGKTIHMELVAEGNSVKLFPLDKDYKSLPLKDIKITATAQPAKKSLVPLTLKPGQASFDGTVDPQGARRVELKIEAELAGKKENFTFQVEPEG